MINLLIGPVAGLVATVTAIFVSPPSASWGIVIVVLLTAITVQTVALVEARK